MSHATATYAMRFRASPERSNGTAPAARWVLIAALVIVSAPPAHAAENLTLYGTSGMDRGQAGIARLQAQNSAHQQNLQHIAACGNAGRLYGPAFSGPRNGNCPSALTLQSSGGVAIAGGATISGTLTVNTGGADITGDSTIAGTLTATGLVTAQSGLSVSGGWLDLAGNYAVRFTSHGGGWHMTDETWLRAYGDKSVYSAANIRAGGQFQIGATVFGPPPSCNINTQKLHWNNGWSCQTLIGSTGAGEQDPKIGTLTANNWCRSTGGQVQCNITPAPACNANTQKLRWTGSAWECVTDNTWASISGKPSTFPPDSHNHDDRYLRLTGGTLTGSLTAPAYYQSSDVRLKRDIQDIEEAVVLLSRLSGKQYVWRDSGQPAYGLIAQAVEEKFPHIVRTDEAGMKSVDYTQFTPLLIEAVRELNARMERLEASHAD